MDEEYKYPMTYYEIVSMIKKDETLLGNLSLLKEIFANEIGSSRRVECITTIDELIDCLERRDILSEHDIGALREIVDTTENPTFWKAITTYKTPLHRYNYGLTNEYRNMRLVAHGHVPTKSNDECQNTDCISQQPKEQTEMTSSVASYSPEAEANIFKMLSKNIGYHWRSLGRELHLIEGQLDGIEHQYPNDLPTRIYKMLQIFKEESSSDDINMISGLCNALDECGRKDLRRKVQQIANLHKANSK